MIWAFHQKMNTRRRNAQICQECLLEARLAGERTIRKQTLLPCPQHGVPMLAEQNIMAWKLWQIAAYQLLIFPDSQAKKNHLELNYAALIPLIQLYVEDRQTQQDTLEKILLCHQISLSSGIFEFLNHHEYHTALEGW